MHSRRAHGPTRIRLLRTLAGHARAHGLRSALGRIQATAAVDGNRDAYVVWCETHTPDQAALERMRRESATWSAQPQITILTAVYNTDPRWLLACADSVIEQTYPHWQWSLADDGSTREETLAALRTIAARDSRIVVTHAAKNGGTAAASNLALSRATGTYVALLDHDDALMPHALHRVVEHLNGAGRDADVLYSDEDKLELDGTRCDAYFKPDWSPDLFRSSMYACHLLVIRRSLMEQVGGFRSAFDFSQDYDLMLRVMEQTSRIHHIPDVLYHWRKVPESTALAGDRKPTAHGAGARALQDHLDRTGVAGEVLDAGPAGLYRMKYRITGTPYVSIVMPTRDPHGPLVRRTLEAIGRNTAYPHVDLLLVSSSGEVPQLPKGHLRMRGLKADGEFRLPAWLNQGVRAAEGDHILVLHDDVEPLTPEWLEAMLELSIQPGVGAVGAKLYYAHGSLQHIGLLAGVNGVFGRPFQGFAPETVGYYSGANCIRNYSAVSAVCLMTRRDVWERVGGFDEALAGPAADLDYGLRVCEAGLRVVFTPYARLTHHESGGISQRQLTPEESAHLRRRWGTRLDEDPVLQPEPEPGGSGLSGRSAGGTSGGLTTGARVRASRT